MESLAPHTLQARKAVRDAYRVAYAKHWSEAAIDVLIAPVMLSTAPRVDSAAPYWGYTAVWNLLQYPAIAFPIGGFKRGGGDLSDYQPRNEKEGIAREYVAEEAEGMPVGLQIVARRLHESVLMEAARVIEDAMKGVVGCRL